MSTEPVARPEPGSHIVLLPVKPPARGKSRLGAADDVRRPLAEAFALDTAAACLGASRVHVVLAVTDDAEFSAQLKAIGCAAIPDGVSGDLNGSLRLAAAEASRRWPGLAMAAICADLPALASADLDAALAFATEVAGPSYVGDAEGTGTTLYVAGLEAFSPMFGLESSARHRGAGAIAIEGELATLRQDVDSWADLEAAQRLGLGPRTSEVTQHISGPPS